MILADKAFELGFIELKLQTMKMIFYWKHEVNTGEVHLTIFEKQNKTKKETRQKKESEKLLNQNDRKWMKYSLKKCHALGRYTSYLLAIEK